MKYLAGIPYVDRIDLLRLALDSIKAYWCDTVIIDNSDRHDLREQTFSQRLSVLEPIVPLTFSQSMNALQRLALEKRCDVLIVMHNDGEAEPGTPEKLLLVVENAIKQGRRWGVAFTNYDVLAAFHMPAVQKVGAWDTNLPQYFSDNDYYRRMRLTGYETLETYLGVRHNASSTIKSDPQRLFVNSITFPLFAEYYRKKWGGDPRRETYETPFNKPGSGLRDRLA